MNKRLRIIHTTEYHCNEPVRFGVHRVLMRPREGHDLRIVQAMAEATPSSSIDWVRDIHGSSIALVTHPTTCGSTASWWWTLPRIACAVRRRRPGPRVSLPI